MTRDIESVFVVSVVCICAGCIPRITDIPGAGNARRLAPLTVEGEYLDSCSARLDGVRIGTVYAPGNNRSRQVIIPLKDASGNLLSGSHALVIFNDNGSSKEQVINIKSGADAPASLNFAIQGYDLNEKVILHEDYESITVRGTGLYPGTSRGGLALTTWGSLDPGPGDAYVFEEAEPGKKGHCVGSVFMALNEVKFLFPRGTMERGRKYKLSLTNDPMYGGASGTSEKAIAVGRVR